MSKKMNKKSVMSLLVIILVGIAVGLGLHNRKEKKKIEKEVKTVLIPNAERKLDSLQGVQTSKTASYEQQVKRVKDLQKEGADLETALGPDWEPGHEPRVVKLFEELERQYYSRLRKVVYEDLGLTEYGEDGVVMGWQELDEEVEKFWEHQNPNTIQELYYLTGNNCYQWPESPIKSGKTILRDSLYVPELEYEERMQGMDWDYYTHEVTDRYDYWQPLTREAFYLTDMARFFKLMEPCLRVMTDDYSEPAWDYLYRFPANNTPEYRIKVLKALQRFAESIDNSGHVFDEATLREFKTAIAETLSILEKQISTETAIYSEEQKAAQLKSGITKVEKAITQQKQELEMLKGPDIVKKLRHDRKHGGR